MLRTFGKFGKDVTKYALPPPWRVKLYCVRTLGFPISSTYSNTKTKPITDGSDEAALTLMD